MKGLHRGGGLPSHGLERWEYLPYDIAPAGFTLSNLVAAFWHDGSADDLLDRSGGDNTLVSSPTQEAAGVPFGDIKGRMLAATSLICASPSAAIKSLTGDAVLEMVLLLSDITTRWLFEVGGNGATETQNVLFGAYLDASSQYNYRHEYGSSPTMVTKNTLAEAHKGVPCHLLVARAGMVVYWYVNGAPIGWSSALPAAPTGGSSAQMVVFGDEAGANKGIGILSSARLWKGETISDAKALAAYRQSRGL